MGPRLFKPAAARPPADAGARPATEQPAYWFCLLEHARQRCDFEAAARARAGLARLGVQVAYGPPCQEVRHG